MVNWDIVLWFRAPKRKLPCKHWKALPSAGSMKYPDFSCIGTTFYPTFKKWEYFSPYWNRARKHVRALANSVKLSPLGASPTSASVLQPCQSTSKAPAARLTHQQRPSKMRMYLPCMCHREAALLGDIATQKHPAQEPGGIPGRNHRGELGRNGFPRRLWLFVLQQVFPQGFHKILIEPWVWNMRIIHFRDCKGVRACRLLSHFPGQLCTVGHNPGQRGCLACFQWVPWSRSLRNVQGNRSDLAAVSSFRSCLSL